MALSQDSLTLRSDLAVVAQAVGEVDQSLRAESASDKSPAVVRRVRALISETQLLRELCTPLRMLYTTPRSTARGFPHTPPETSIPSMAVTACVALHVSEHILSVAANSELCHQPATRNAALHQVRLIFQLQCALPCAAAMSMLCSAPSPLVTCRAALTARGPHACAALTELFADVERRAQSK